MVVEAVLVFVVVWWVLFFISLPIKLEMDEDAEGNVGCASGAPKKSYLAIKVLCAIVGAGCVTCAYCYLKSAGYVDSWLDSIYSVIP